MEQIKLDRSITLTGGEFPKGDVQDLHAVRIANTLPSGEILPGFLSAYKLSPEEIEHITRTGIIYYQVLGTGFSPMMLCIDNPLTHPEYRTEHLEDAIKRLENESKNKLG